MNFMRRAVSTLAAAALLATGTVGAVAYSPSPNSLPAAVAQETTPALDGIPDGGTLNIHKIIGLESDTAASNGLPITNPSELGDPAVGVTYYVYQVMKGDGGVLDLTTQEGWVEAAGLTESDFFDTSDNPLMNLDTLIPNNLNARLGAVSPKSTEASGIAEFELDTGLYLVVEQNNPYSGGAPGAGGVAVAPSAPFLVTVPLTHPTDRDSWLNEVHVYPKGQQFASPTKRVIDPTTGEGVDLAGSNVGDLIGYEVSAFIPDISTGTLPGLSITDKLDTELSRGAVASVTIGEEVLGIETDYTVRSWTVGGQDVVIARLTPEGLQRLGDGNQTVTVVFTAQLDAVPENGLTNTAWFRRVEPGVIALEGWDPANPGEGPHPGTPTNAVNSTYGEIVITKSGEDANGDEANLAGAQFELRRCYSENQGNAGELVADGLPIRIGGQTSWATSNGEAEGETLGMVTISGIHLSNTQPGDDATPVTTSIWANEDTTEYCLVETQAPEGYELLPAPYLLGNELTGAETDFTPVSVNIENVRANAGFNLPLTGGMGIWIALGGGVVLLLLAAGYYAARNRQQS